MPLPLALRPATLETAPQTPRTGRGTAVMDQESEFASMYQAEFTPVSRTVFLIVHDRQRAEDITQDAFIQLYSHWGRVSRYDRPGAWVRRVAIRLAVRHQNRERIRAVLERDAEPPTVPEPADVDLLRSMRQLPPAYRAALVLHYYEDWPVAEVASVLGWTVSATKVTLMRARRRLGGLLQEEVAEDVS
jgi:RNA polymerase sigma factor (sigma-70 family)